ncbi:MAG TPA: 3-oxoacyl-[acyl-carrier-protein] synthase III C-terminal domain-containing protein [Solirubrobacteraceae bacterium]|nr:3-oxoacyl-[acyl-carrier-protein] synthase III C-terminal domain-containing protein [Solirubrobacteraceae bacterium]
MRARAGLAGLGAAFPATRGQRELWDGFFGDHYRHAKKPRAVWLRCGVERRHGVADPFVEDVRWWSTGKRMERFARDALPLGVEAITSSLGDAGLAADDVDHLAVVTCTGYGTPGLDVRLAAELGMRADVQRTHIGHMGCYAAIPGLATVADAAAARDRVSVLLCLELTSLHVQPPSDDPEQLVAHALFSDAAVAATVVPGAGGLDVVDVAALTDPSTAALMTWDVTDLGFRMGLSSRVPEVLDRHVEGLVDGLLARHGHTREDVGGWAVHPGGPRILEVVADRLGLEAGALDASRTVLRDHGNCSSATVLLVLDELRRTAPPEPGAPVVALAFGPGLTLYGALLRAR